VWMVAAKMSGYCRSAAWSSRAATTF